MISRLKDKKFRLKVIVVVITLIIMWNTYGGEKKEAKTFDECNTYNSAIDSIIQCAGWVGACGPWKWVDDTTHWGILYGNDVARCRDNGCYVGRKPIDYWGDKNLCVPYVPVGWAAEDGYAEEACQAGGGCIGSDFGDTHVWCRTCNEDDKAQVCNSAERSVAKIVDSMGIKIDSCKTKYYLVIFGGGLMLFMVIGMML